MAYTQSPDKSKSTPGNFGGQANDANRVAIAAGSRFETRDATDTPETSPLTVNTQKTLKVPQDAKSCTIISTTNPVQISEDSTQSTYFTLPAGIPITVDCTRQQYIYLKTGSSTVVNFLFNTI